MNMREAIDMEAAKYSGFKGRKPKGSIKGLNATGVLNKAKEMWGDGASWSMHLSRAMASECPHIKAGHTFTNMTPTQQMNVAKYMHGRAQQRLRANRMKGFGKQVTISGSAAKVETVNPLDIFSGGSGSGDFGHSGRKGEQGGSSKGGSKGILDKYDTTSKLAKTISKLKEHNSKTKGISKDAIKSLGFKRKVQDDTDSGVKHYEHPTNGTINVDHKTGDWVRFTSNGSTKNGNGLSSLKHSIKDDSNDFFEKHNSNKSIKQLAKTIDKLR